MAVDTPAQALRREQVDQRQHSPLGKHREREQQQDRGEQIDELRPKRRGAHSVHG